ncbi:hypothetical protein BVRB_7g158570 [Beta vulgaris subsp. vulgaris]|nr:hypothetical protein BVRB_7g158570 [Beta vulgaris subsp. vulgaris]
MVEANSQTISHSDQLSTCKDPCHLQSWATTIILDLSSHRTPTARYEVTANHLHCRGNSSANITAILCSSEIQNYG